MNYIGYLCIKEILNIDVGKIKLYQSTKKSRSPAGKQRFLLAVSGGADSMVLASLFKDSRDEMQGAGYEFQVAHINYKLRGEDSDLDQKVVEDFCEKNHLKFHLYEVSEKDKKPENSIQLWARELRYAFLKKFRKRKICLFWLPRTISMTNWKRSL